ncbi:MAG TPA: patatin-like phospholipase family protein [Candidatus Sulfotelmatobacter sp.]|nr:patatin-like phospholipase family protein [Candidatus Sulfotelmatobacter sp.]
MHSAARTIGLALFFGTAILSLCQTQPPTEQTATPNAATESARGHRSVVGIALSGGGALGLAHIGVLQWLEENHIPVERIAGTSMGGIVGAAYATGMSPADVRRFASEVNWDEALLGEPNYRQLSFRRKQDRRDYQVGAELGLKHGLNGPNGINPGQGVTLLLDRIAFPYSTIAGFDDLPIPFRCVGTDLQDGTEVILKDGSLAQALRATMAIPGVFTPVELNGRLLADGGLVDNVPADVVRQMGADAVIAVAIATPLGGKEKLNTLTGILSRAIDVMILQNERRSIGLATVVIELEPGVLSINDYSQADKIIQLGYDGAAKKAGELRRYAISDSEWESYLAQRNARRRTAPTSVQELEVTGVGPSEQQHLTSRLQNVIGAPLDQNQLGTRLNRIAGQGQFDRLGYEGFVQNGVPGLRIVAHEKSYGPPFVNLAVDVDGSGVAAFDFAAGARVTFTDIKDHGGEWRNEFLLGSRDLAATEFYQPLAGTHLFVAPYAFASKFARNAFTGPTRVAIFGDERAGGGLDLGYDFNRLSELRVGYELFSGKLAPLVGDAGLPTVRGSTGQFRARYVWDSQDSPAIPSRGTRIVASLARVLQSPGLSRSMDQFEVQTSTFVPTGPKTSLFFDISGGTSFGSNAGPFQVFALGGPFRLGAYFPQEFLGNHYGYASLGFRRELYRLPQLVGKKLYWGGWYEAGSAFNSSTSIGVKGSINLGVMADTIVGPIALATSVSPTGQSRVNFSVGRLF